MAEWPEVGQAVKYVDPSGEEHNALVTNSWGENCVNLVYVSGDANKTDQYGRQIERSTSVVEKCIQQAPGQYFQRA